MSLVVKPFHITFGQRFRTETHPVTVEGAVPHPDGYVTVEAIDMHHAMNRAGAYFGDNYSAIYTPEGLVTHFYPKGELAYLKFTPGAEGNR